jgi:tetratricopeptide (TPR) repeat protein
VPSLLAGLFLAVLFSGLSFPALGAPEAKAAAKAHYEAGTRLYDVHEYGEALKEYKAGYLTRPDPSFLFNIGQCYKRLGQPEQARDFFREYLKKASPEDPNRVQAEARIREIDTRQIAAPTPPAGAEATPISPAPGNLPAGAVDKSPALLFSVVPAIASGGEPAGVDLSASNTSQPDRSESAFYRTWQTWWVWSGVGAVVVAGTVTAVLLSRSGDSGLNVSGTTLGTRKVLP